VIRLRDFGYYPQCKKEIAKHTRKNSELEKALREKIRHILENPEIFKPMHAPLAGLRRVHILKSHVLLYKIEAGRVVFVRFAHHDEAYA